MQNVPFFNVHQIFDQKNCGGVSDGGAYITIYV